MKKFMTEFKEFIARGDVMSMAVGIIIGGAFTAIVNSLVGDIITPLIGMITGGIDFTGLCQNHGRQFHPGRYRLSHHRICYLLHDEGLQ